MDKPKKPKTQPEPVHQPGTSKGEEVVKEEGREPGREDIATNEAGRPIGKSKARDDKDVGSQEPTDPDSPYLQAP